jgi:hypothetical protein
LNGWLTAVNVERIRLDEKVLRGSQREGEAPWMGVAALDHRVGRVLGQMVVGGRDPTEAALALLEPISLEGRMVTLDAGWMTQPVVRKGVEKGGATWRRSKGTHRRWRRRCGLGGGAMGDGTALPMSGKFPRATVGWRSENSGWRRARSGGLEAEDGGPGLRFGGVIRRRRCRLSRRSEPEAWVEPEPIGVAGGSVGRRRARGEVLEGPRGR